MTLTPFLRFVSDDIGERIAKLLRVYSKLLEHVDVD